MKLMTYEDIEEEIQELEGEIRQMNLAKKAHWKSLKGYSAIVPTLQTTETLDAIEWCIKKADTIREEIVELKRQKEAL